MGGAGVADPRLKSVPYSGTDDHDAVGYRLPVIELVPTAAEDTVVGHLGPDLLGPDWNLDEAVRRISASLTARLVRRCWTSGTSQVSARSIGRSCSFSTACIRARRSATSAICGALSSADS